MPHFHRLKQTLFPALGLLLFCNSAYLQATENLKPYILASQSKSTLSDKIATVKTALTKQGFEIAGEYSPYEKTDILIVTNDTAKKLAGQSPLGGYGVAQRVALTAVADEVQVSYTNPLWMSQVYRMEADLSPIASGLKTALGATEAFGSEAGKSAGELGKYHYMMMMPYFDDAIELASHKTHEGAITAIEAHLAKATAGTKKVFRIDIPNKKQTLFGIAINTGDGADKTIMTKIDGEKLKHTAHLPYEILVDEGKVMMLHGKFRIAQSFPDLSMGRFMGISSAPDAIETVLREVSQP